MEFLKREAIDMISLPGRDIQLAAGKESAVLSSNTITMGFSHYTDGDESMSPHRHAEEIVYVLSAQNGWVRFGGFGDLPDQLGEPIPLENGMILHVPENEWHVFEVGGSGSVDLLFFFSQAVTIGQ